MFPAEGAESFWARNVPVVSKGLEKVTAMVNGRGQALRRAAKSSETSIFG